MTVFQCLLFSSLCPNFLQMCQWHWAVGLLSQRNEVMSESCAPFPAPPPLERFVSLWCLTFAGFSQMSQALQCLILFLALRLATARCQKRPSWALNMEWASKAQSCCPSGKRSLVISSMEPRSSLTHSSLEVGVSEWLGGGWVQSHSISKWEGASTASEILCTTPSPETLGSFPVIYRHVAAFWRFSELLGRLSSLSVSLSLSPISQGLRLAAGSS